MEILVAVSVILVLAALLLPAMQGGLAKSRGMACTSNLRQIASAIQLYAGDHDNFLPELDPAGVNGWRYQSRQVELLAPYLESKGNLAKILACPMATPNDSGKTWPDYFSAQIDGQTFTTDYKLNDNGALLKVPLASLPHAATLVVAADLDWQVDVSKKLRHPGGKTGGLNFAFFDGSVRRLTSAQYQGSDQYGASPWYAWGTK